MTRKTTEIPAVRSTDPTATAHASRLPVLRRRPDSSVRPLAHPSEIEAEADFHFWTCSVPSTHCLSNMRRRSGAATASKPGSIAELAPTRAATVAGWLSRKVRCRRQHHYRFVPPGRRRWRLQEVLLQR